MGNKKHFKTYIKATPEELDSIKKALRNNQYISLFCYGKTIHALGKFWKYQNRVLYKKERKG